MKQCKFINLFLIIITVLFISGCNIDPTKFYPEPGSDKITAKPKSRYMHIDGITSNINQDLRNFINTASDYKERKVAIFSIDGALIKKTPYYASDESMFSYAKKNPEWNSEIIKKVLIETPNSDEYIKDKTLYWNGMYVDQVENIGGQVLRDHYSFYPEIYDLLCNLQVNDFEIWLITSSPEVLYQKFLSEYLNIPMNRIIGSKTVIQNGKLTDEFILPLINKEGKQAVVETFIKATPLIVVGHSYLDVDMIKNSGRIKIIVNPDNQVQHKSLNNNRVDEYAVKNKWIILDIKDIPDERSEGMVSGIFKVKENPAIDI